jgi:hypothetical protein
MELFLSPDSLKYRIGPIWGALDVDLGSIAIPIDKTLLPSRNPGRPGLQWSDYIWHGLLMSHELSTGGDTTWIEVKGLSSIGFWAEWKSQGDGIHIVVDEKGEEIQYPYGVFCAVRSNATPSISGGRRLPTPGQRMSADGARQQQQLTSAAFDPEVFGR